MNVWFGERDKGFEESDIQRAVESLTQMSFEDFFSAYVEGTEELPYEEYFHYAGLEVYEEVSEKVELPFSLDTKEDGTPRIRGLVSESPAWRAGLREGDRLLRVNQRRESVGDQLVRLEPGREIALEVERGKEQLTVRFYPETRLEGIVDLAEANQVSPLQLAVRQGLMTGNP
jgi:predicted metalloprotease with PDZ domain